MKKITYRCYDDPEPEVKKVEVIVKQDERGRPYIEDPEGKRLFTQEHMDSEIGKARVNARKEAEATIAELTKLKDQVGMSEAAKKQLQEQIEGLQTRHMSAEQTYQNEIQKWRTRYDEETKVLAQQRDTAIQQYNEQLINTSIIQEAESHKAIRATQILDLLARSAKVEPILTDKGEDTGKREVTVKIRDIDASSKDEIQVVLPVTKAIKRMKELPEFYGNLFSSEERGGTGHNHTLMGQRKINGVDISSPQAYIDSVNKNPGAVTNKR